MPDPNATPAPLTMTPEQEALDRSTQYLDTLRAYTELDATRAKLARQAEALRECEEWFDGRADVDDGPDGQPVPNSAMRMQQLCAAALSPSQDAKDGGAV